MASGLRSSFAVRSTSGVQGEERELPLDTDERRAVRQAIARYLLKLDEGRRKYARAFLVGAVRRAVAITEGDDGRLRRCLLTTMVRSGGGVKSNRSPAKSAY